MTAQAESTRRFLRPADAERTPRNYRRIQMQRLLAVARNVVVVLAIAAVVMSLYRQTQSDRRFAVRHIEIIGAVHTPRAALHEVVNRYVGLNLFRLDIARVHSDLAALSWINGVEIEKKLPDTLRIRVSERSAVALVESSGTIRYVDAAGIEFAELSPEVGDADLPLITAASGPDLVRCVALVRELRGRDPQVYARISEVRRLPPRGLALFDRRIAAFVYADEGHATGQHHQPRSGHRRGEEGGGRGRGHGRPADRVGVRGRSRRSHPIGQLARRGFRGRQAQRDLPRRHRAGDRSLEVDQHS